MTTVMLASSILSGSLMSMLVPMATVVVVIAWGVLLIRRRERRRERVDSRNRPPADTDTADGSRSAGAS
jgi:nitrate reductase gamma subunit